MKLNNKVKHLTKVNERTVKVHHREGDQCPSCLEGKLVKRQGKYGKFLGCWNFPKCKYIAK